MKSSKKKIVILIIIISMILIFFIHKLAKHWVQEDLIFFQFWNGETIKSESEKTNQFEVKVSKVRRNYTNLNLLQTINSKTLVNEKIAPGTSGNFKIILISNQNLKYKIGFNSQNNKPKNLKFFVDNQSKKYNTLEELGKTLCGNIKSNETKTINVNWQWDYEINPKEDKQDTEDGERIKKYNFGIYTIGEE